MNTNRPLQFVVNGETVRIEADPEMPLLWALRDRLGLTGTKYGCGAGLCGACLVHVDGEVLPSCVVPVQSVEGKEIVTIEGLAADPQQPIMQAWLAEGVSQCGYCQPGQIMAAAALLARNPHPSQTEIERAMARVLCRCGTYQRIRSAMRRLARLPEQGQTPS